MRSRLTSFIMHIPLVADYSLLEIIVHERDFICGLSPIF